MPRGIRLLQDQIANLSDAEFERLAEWFYRLHEQRTYQSRRKTHKGIPYKKLLQVFTKQEGKVPWIPRASMAATTINRFYREQRVEGCDPDGGEDVLMLEWGPASKTEFRLAYVREIGPPTPSGERPAVWHLTLDMRFPTSRELDRLKSGVKSFPSLRQVQEGFIDYALTSKVGKATRNLKPSRVAVTYENVE